MKFSFMNQLLALLCIMLIGGARIAFAQDDNSTAVTVNAPTITPDSRDYDGNISVTITVDKGCTIIYKWGNKFYTSTELQNVSAKTVDDDNITLSIKGKNTDRFLSAIAVKDNNGTKSYSEAAQVKYTYVSDNKKVLTLAADDINIKKNGKQQIVVTAKDGYNTITGLTFHYESDNTNVATVDDNGYVTGIMAGNATITISFFSDDTYKTATCQINVTVTSDVISTDDGTVFTSIADLRKAGETVEGNTWILKFDETNAATVVAALTKNEEKLGEGAGTAFIVDNSGLGLYLPKLAENEIYKNTISKLKQGDKITGTLIGQYKERKSGIPEFTTYKTETKDKKYTTNLNIDRSGEATKEEEATYPINIIKDVNTLANKNDKEPQKASFGPYLNTIISVPGTIRKGTQKGENEYYLVQDENTKWTDDTKRIFISVSQLDGITLDDYVGTSGVFEGILIKRENYTSQISVLKNNFYSIKKIYLDENDPEDRITDLVNNGSFDDEVDIYVHRPKLVNSVADAWNTLCFPFDLTAEDFEKAFGCELKALAAPSQKGNTTVDGRTTIVGDVDANGNLLFESKSDLQIEAGMPYLMKASGTQTYGCTPEGFSYTNTNGSYIDNKTKNTKTPEEIYTETKGVFYAHIGQKFITVVPPHQIQGKYDNNVVNGKFYFRGLYGRKDSTEDRTANLYDNDSEKYQYISTGEGNYLKYLTSDNQKLKFPGMRAYFYFPYWNAANNNKQQTSGNTTNSKIHIFVDGSTTGIHDIESTEGTKTANDGRIYNLAGQVVDSSYKGIVIKNGRKYLAK